jgi:hypothetical protein
MALVPNQSAEARPSVKISRKSQFSGGCQRLQAEPPRGAANRDILNIFSELIELKRVMSDLTRLSQPGATGEKKRAQRAQINRAIFCHKYLILNSLRRSCASREIEKQGYYRARRTVSFAPSSSIILPSAADGSYPVRLNA